MAESKTDEHCEFEVWYWRLKNRGNFVRLLFAEAGKNFKDCDDTFSVQQKIKSPQGNFNEEENKDIFDSPMAPPFIIHHLPSSNSYKQSNPTIISHTEHCVGYVAEQIGLRPEKLEDHYRAQNIVGNCNDIFRDLFQSMYDSKAQDFNTEPVKKFISGRWKIWMEILQKPLTRSKDQLFYFGDKISQADIAVFNILNGMEELFEENGFNKLITENYPILSSHYKRIGNRHRIKLFLDKQHQANIPWFPQADWWCEYFKGWSVITKAVREMLYEEWEIWYWPLKNRGNHIRLLFAEKGVEFKDVNDELVVQKKIRSSILGKWDDEENKDWIDHPMSPPFIIHRIGDNDPIIISQVEHCVGYVAEKLGLRPDKLEDHYRAQTIVGNVNDIYTECYETMISAQKQGQNTDVIKCFINGRWRVWMNILHKPLTRNKDQLFYIDDRLSQADIVVFNLINGFETELFGEKGFNKLIKKNYPLLVQHYERVKRRDNIKKFLIKQDEAGIPWYPKNLLHFQDVGWGIFTKGINELVTESK